MSNHNEDNITLDKHSVALIAVGGVICLALMFFFGYTAGLSNRSNCEVSAQANGIQYTVCTKEIK
jgi:hypothetical protein